MNRGLLVLGILGLAVGMIALRHIDMKRAANKILDEWKNAALDAA